MQPAVETAPGRLDFMGGVSDYSGGLVLQVATAALTTATLAAAPTPPGAADCASLSTEALGGGAPTAVPLAWLRAWCAADAGAPLAQRLAGVRAHLQALGTPRWVAYAFGALAAYCGETGWAPPLGHSLALTIASRVPLSQGVSSSASIEVAVLRALRAAALPGGEARPRLEDLRLAHVAQHTENYVVGAPCGLMDQLASSLGAAGRVLPILCRPDAVEPLVALPRGVVVVGWPSGAEHELGGTSPYAVARAASFMAKRMLEGLLRSGSGSGSGAAAAAVSLPLRFLTELQPSELAAVVAGLPETITGSDFLAAHGGVDDALTAINPSLSYPVRAGAVFPIEETFRCRTALALLRAIPGQAEASVEATLALVGELMRQTHRGYSTLGLGAPELDQMLAALTAEVGLAGGVYGARISGGGSGGTMAILCHERALPAISALATRLTFGKPFPGLIM